MFDCSKALLLDAAENVMQYDVIGCDKNWVLHLQHNIAHTTTNPKKKQLSIDTSKEQKK
jgi:hypothetical protein